ncbi:hypothetical protein FIBSPDRAFT_881189 [Athelia psychrophila]|uniref:Uncharacterized protein n=1 Tax=Athelia psychrophila TaxID=1759441 RepID=A0A166XEJ0_9AGAM|nr:hypothetical protein FIBSPDRAFT_881189 [Fibularhizoctonia sp. CBS 109695]
MLGVYDGSRMTAIQVQVAWETKESLSVCAAQQRLFIRFESESSWAKNDGVHFEGGHETHETVESNSTTFHNTKDRETLEPRKAYPKADPAIALIWLNGGGA